MSLRPLFLSLLYVLAACSSGGASSLEGKADDEIAGNNPTDPSSQQPKSSSSGDPDSTPRSPGNPASTCEGRTGAPGESPITLPSGGRAREATILVPKSYDGKTPLPVVLVLHPLLLTMNGMRPIVNIEPHVESKNFIALFANGVDRSWNAGECCGTAKDEKVDDVAFIEDLLALVRKTWCVDPSRLFSMGFSNGAFLSHRLACELPDGVTAIFPVAGTLGIPEPACKPKHRTPVFAFHGTADPLVPFEGGSPKIPLVGQTFGTFQAPTATDAFWARTNGCSSATTTGFTKGEVSCKVHAGCEADVTLCSVAGGGHQWPGGPPLPAMGHLTKDVDATAMAIEFFEKHGI